MRKIIYHRHTNKENTFSRWNRIVQINFMSKDKYYNVPEWFFLINKHCSDFLHDEVVSNKGLTSTVERILTISNIKKYIPIDDKFEFKHENSKNILNKILDDINNDILNTRTINTTEQIQEYWTNLMNIKNKISNVKIENTENIKNQQKNLNNSFENKNQNVKQGENPKKIKVTNYHLGELEITNKKLEHNDFQAIPKLLDELKILKYFFTKKTSKKKLYEMLPIASLSLIRNLFEQLLKFYLKTYFNKKFQELTNKNNQSEQNIKLNEIIKKIVNLINQNVTIFNKDIDNEFKTLSSTSKDFLNMIMHNPSSIIPNSSNVEQFASGFMCNLFKFILNKQ